MATVPRSSGPGLCFTMIAPITMRASMPSRPEVPPGFSQ
jgi:hypothetical protein